MEIYDELPGQRHCPRCAKITTMVKESNQQTRKLEAETDKLSAEADYFRADTNFIGVRIVLQGIATGAAVLGVMIGAVKTFGGV